MAQTNILLETGTNELEIVEFYVNQDGYEAHYGLNVAKVVEIGRRQTVTAMPEMRHKALLGAFPHRNGRIVPLIDMAQFLGSGPITNEDAKVIVTEFNTVCTGFLVSGVNRIYRLSWTDVEAPGNFLQNVSRSSVTGVVRLEERVIFLLDLEAIDMARKLMRTQGVCAGISTGANVLAALGVASRPEMRGKNIVTFACDTGERYMSTALFQDQD